MADLGELTVRLDADSDSFRAAMQRAERQVQTSAGSIQRSLGTLDAASSRAGGGLNQVTNAAGLTGNQMRQLAPQINDVVTQLASGTPVFQIFAQQGGQIVQALGGLGATLSVLAGPIGAAVLAAGALGGAYFALRGATADATKAQEAFNKAMEAANDLLLDQGEKTQSVAAAKRAAAADDLQNAAAQKAASAAAIEVQLRAAEQTLAELEGQSRVATAINPRGGDALAPQIDEMQHRVSKLRGDLAVARADMNSAEGRLGALLGQETQEERDARMSSGQTAREIEEQRRAAADDQRQKNIEAEIELQKELDAETTERIGRESDLQKSLDAEKEESRKAEEDWSKRRQSLLEEEWRTEQQKIDRAAKGTDDAARQLGFTFESAFENAALRGGKLRDVLAGIEQDIARITLRQTVTQPAAGALSGLINAGIGAIGTYFSGSAAFNSQFGSGADITGAPPMAEGGAVTPGVPYMVGERGRELFVPQMPGSIVSNDNLGAGSGVTVVQHFTIQTGVAQTVRAEVLSMMPAIQAQTLRTVQDAARRNRRAT